jgi:5-methylcytosine-specific restriction endonuclease McrA
MTPRYDWAAVQQYYDAGHTYRDCRRRFGFAAAAWTKAVRRGALIPRPARRALPELLDIGKDPGSKKRRLLQEGILTNQCSECGLDSWLGEALVVQLDHVNGDNADWRLENLRMLCPNCHSQTPTYARANPKCRPPPLKQSLPGAVEVV